MEFSFINPLLIPFINKIKNLNLIACCDTLTFRLKDALGNAPDKTIGYEDYKDLLNNKDVDAVLIATPFSTHHTIALDAIESGKPIWDITKEYLSDIKYYDLDKVKQPRILQEDDNFGLET